MVSIRGAITVDNNTKEDILKETKILLKDIINRNNIDKEHIISIIFTATKDLTAAYPAISARELDIVQASLLCVQEMNVDNSLQKCIRVMIYVEGDLLQKNVTHVYLKDAKALRPDLSLK
ncbi:MAG: chorismate mutase [Vallitalea sp.]|jgi:monofunctional chorismate mutase|nr:chorismate mutase [Vallitalea sp.]